jgi:hypothetical protein
MKQCGLGWKQTGSKLVVYGGADTAGKPFPGYSIDAFRFYLLLNNPYFLNFTNIAPQWQQQQRFYLSNLANNKKEDILFLSQPIALHDADLSYLPGQMVMNDLVNNEVFECIADNPAPASKATTDADFWMKRGKMQYVTANDLLRFSTGDCTVALPVPATTVTVNIYTINTLSNDYNLPARPQQQFSFDKVQNSFTASLAGLPAGKYAVNVNGVSRTVYYDPQAVASNAFAVVDIFTHPPHGSDYAILNTGGILRKDVNDKLTPNAYIIRFANRAVLWKYILKKDTYTQIEDTAPVNKLTFSKDKNIFTSQKPIPLTQAPVKTLFARVGGPKTSDPPLKNPSVDRLQQLATAKGNFYCTEIYINY